MRSQRGQAFIFVLIFLTLGSFAIVPNLRLLYTVITGQRIAEEYLEEQYAADAALEDAFWRIMNVDLLGDLALEPDGKLDYSFQPDFFDQAIPVTITYAEAPPSAWVETGDRRMRIKSTVDPAWTEDQPGTTQYFDYVLFAHNQFTGVGNKSLQDEISILIPGALQYVAASTEDTVPAEYDPENPAEWPTFGNNYAGEPVETLIDGVLWQDGNPTWDEIASFPNTEVIDVLGDEEVVLSSTPGPLLPHTIIYDFEDVTNANAGTGGNPIAIEHESNQFPWTRSNQQDSSDPPSNPDYVNISANNTAEWTTATAGNNDEMAITYQFFIQEDISDISEIEITWNGNTGGAAASDHSIYLRKDGFDEFDGSNTWVQAAGDSPLSITQNVDTDLVGTLSSGFSTYVNGTTGQFEFVVANGAEYAAMNTNYVQVKVTYLASEPIYNTSGTVTSNSITVTGLEQWFEFSFDADQPASTTVTFQIEYWDGDSWEVIPNTDLAGNEAGFAYDASPIDLTGVDIVDYDEIRLKAALSTTDVDVTPTINNWQVEAMGPDSKRRLTWYYTPTPLAISGRDAYLLRFQVSGTPTWGLHYAEPAASFNPGGNAISGPTGPLSVGMYHVTVQAGGKTIKAVVSYTASSGIVHIISYQIYG